MAGPFKLKSGNGPLKFKNLGSSPVKQVWDKVDMKAVKKFTKLKKPSAQEFLKKNTVKPKPHVKPKGVLGPGTRPLHHKVAKDIAKFKNIGGKVIKKIAGKVASRLIPGVGWGLLAHDVIKTIPKVVKSTDKALRKEAKRHASGSAKTNWPTGPKY